MGLCIVRYLGKYLDTTLELYGCQTHIDFTRQYSTVLETINKITYTMVALSFASRIDHTTVISETVPDPPKIISDN